MVHQSDLTQLKAVSTYLLIGMERKGYETKMGQISFGFVSYKVFIFAGLYFLFLSQKFGQFSSSHAMRANIQMPINECLMKMK